MDSLTARARNLLPLLLLAAPASAQTEQARWRAQAARVDIARDDWGIAHVTGRTDADAVFGAIYAQAEDDFARVEANYLTALGRTAEAEGEGAVWQDLRQRLFVDPAELQEQYRASAPWLRQLMDAWAAGLNFYLLTHPAVKPKVLKRFEPWMALSFTEGSIGGDIERIDLGELAKFYGGTVVAAAKPIDPEPRGSNGIAIAPRNTVNGNALLLINPHTSFYFRSELQMTSGEGLNAYGASTWGQFFIYQGFNVKAGWMHTSSGVDAVDRFAEDVSGRTYRHGGERRPLVGKTVTVRFRKSDGTLGTRTFTTWRTHHGPIVARAGGKWIAQGLMWRPVAALEQSWLRTKAIDLRSYLQVAERQANSSNDTIFADAEGTIAYLHPQFVPLRDERFDYGGTVDGADPATDWRGTTPFAGLPQAIRPAGGWVMNTNDAPWSAAGSSSPVQSDYPRYMDTAGENPRGLHATMLLADKTDWTAEKLMAAAYDPYLPAFAALVPRLVAAYSILPAADPRRAALAGPIDLLRRWDFRWSERSLATTLAMYWGEELRERHGPITVRDGAVVTAASAAEQLAALEAAVARMTREWGSWQVPWGQVNRFQRLDDAIRPHFDDAKPSAPVPFASAAYGSLASFGAKPYPHTKRWYGTSGNSFVAVVEFAERPRAWAVMAGGQSGDPASPHFADQVSRYAGGQLRRVYFEPGDLVGHTERRYRPGEP